MANDKAFVTKSGLISLNDVDVTGNIIVSGTVDGRDLATDGSKLDGISPSATVGVIVQEEGVDVLTAPTTLNFVGTPVTVTDVGGVATVTVTGGAGDVAWQEEGTPVVTSATANFVGAAVTVTDVGGVATITVTGGGDVAWQEEGTPVVTSATANFVGSNITVTDVGGVATITVADAAPLGADPTGVFKATMSATVNNLTGDGTIIDVPYNTVDVAQDFVSFNTGTGVATIQKDGVYFIGASVRGVQSGTAATGSNATITINDVVVKETVLVSSAGEVRFVTPVSGFFSLNNGDTVKITYSVSGSTLVYDIDNRAHQTYFEITRISLNSFIGTVDKYLYTATASQTAFSGADDNINTLTFSADDVVSVYLNGVLLIETTDYTLNATTDVITLTSGTLLNDELHVHVLRAIISTLDSDITTPADGDTLVYDSGTGKWINQVAPVLGTYRAGITTQVNNVTGDNTNYQIIWNNEITTTSFCSMNTGTGVFTLDPGTYVIQAGALTAGGVASDYINIKFNETGTGNQSFGANMGGATSGRISGTYATSITASTTFYVSVQVEGASLTADLYADSRTFLRVTKVG